MLILKISSTVLAFVAGMVVVSCANQCENGGTEEQDVHPICQCPHGFKGFNCSQRVTPCEGRPCRNNGICKELKDGTFNCICSSLFIGNLCEQKVPPCYKIPCKNGGNCTDDGEKCFKCRCPPGFKGSDCSEIVQPCEINPCKNDAICTNTNGTFLCACKEGFGGVMCTKKVPVGISLPSKVLKGHPEGIKKLQEWLGDQRDWRLCYRATEHGWESGEFHSRCDNKKPTLTIVLVKHYIFGAYADVAFGGLSGFRASTESFIFSIKNKDNLSPFKSPVFRKPEKAVFTDPVIGPTFGDGKDIFISNLANTKTDSYVNLGATYALPSGYVFQTSKARELIAGTFNFTPSEVEVFYLG